MNLSMLLIATASTSSGLFAPAPCRAPEAFDLRKGLEMPLSYWRKTLGATVLPRGSSVDGRIGGEIVTPLFREASWQVKGVEMTVTFRLKKRTAAAFDENQFVDTVEIRGLSGRVTETQLQKVGGKAIRYLLPDGIGKELSTVRKGFKVSIRQSRRAESGARTFGALSFDRVKVMEGELERIGVMK